MLRLDQEDHAVAPNWIWHPEVFVRHLVDDPPGGIAFDPFDHAPADLRHAVWIGAVGDRDRDSRLAGEVPCLREFGDVRKAIRSPSSSTQTGTLWGAPSGSTVATWAKFAPSIKTRTFSGRLATDDKPRRSAVCSRRGLTPPVNDGWHDGPGSGLLSRQP